MGFTTRKKDAPAEVVNWKLFWVTFVAAGGSVIFGYDLAFMSGVFSLPSFVRRFELADENASAIQAHMVNTCKFPRIIMRVIPYPLTDRMLAVQGGAFFGVALFYYFNERFGRRVALFSAGWLFKIGVVIQMVCQGNIPVFYVGRLVSGLGIGGTTFVIPQYLAECAPAHVRGSIIGCVSTRDRYR